MRLLLSIGISIWIAGGCLLGCSGTAVGAEAKHHVQTVVAVPSCHAHAKQANGAPSRAPSFAPAPRGMMKDCPLLTSATAATSKNSGHLPDPGRGPVSDLPLIAQTTVQSTTSRVVPYLPTRGPTYLRCCVFLI